MSHWLDEPRHLHEVVTVRTLWVTIALSLLVHLAALFVWLPRIPLLTPPGEGQELVNDRLQVRLAAVPKPTPIQTPAPSNEIVALARPLARPPRTALRTRPPPVLVAPSPTAPTLPTPPPATLAVPAPPRMTPPVEGDLWSYIQARRRERGEAETPPVAIAKADPNAGLAANLPGAHDIAQGDDEWGLGARLEERLEALHRIVLGQEELDGVRLEQGAPIAHERQEVLAHPGGHYGEPVKKPSSRRRNIREN